MSTDYLIIGQGIAGTLLTHELLKRGKKIAVVDNHHHSSSSMVAAGLFNPVVFKRFVKSWMADKLLPAADEAYTTLEKELNASFYHQKNIYKIFASADEKKLWEKKREEIAYMLPAAGEYLPDIINNLHGGGEVRGAGNLNIQLFLQLFRKFLDERNLLINEKMNCNELEIEKDKIVWKEIKASKIIFCEGHSATQNPFFNWLPFKLTKGELLTIEAQSLPADKIINKGAFLLPLHNSTFKAGATYEWDDLTETPTGKGKAELSEKIGLILKTPFCITGHTAGIRPTVNDRRPIIGLHPIHKNIAIFNGMGTKGVMLAPYFAKQLCRFLDGEEELHAEADIARFYNHYRHPLSS